MLRSTLSRPQPYRFVVPTILEENAKGNGMDWPDVLQAPNKLVD